MKANASEFIEALHRQYQADRSTGVYHLPMLKTGKDWRPVLKVAAGERVVLVSTAEGTSAYPVEQCPVIIRRANPEFQKDPVFVY